MKTIPTLYDLRYLITADNAAKVASGKTTCEHLLDEDDDGSAFDKLYALPLLKDALKRLHQIHEKKRLALAALEIARNLLKDFSYDTFSSQEDGESLCDSHHDWTVIQVNEGLDGEAQDAQYVIAALNEVL